MLSEQDCYEQGNQCIAAGNLAWAKIYYDGAPSHQGAQWNKSLIYLLEGKYDQWQSASLVPAGSDDGMWHGPKELPGTVWGGWHTDSLTVISDQGAGDTLLFSRYLAEVRKRTRVLRIVCDKSLHRLMRHITAA